MLLYGAEGTVSDVDEPSQISPAQAPARRDAASRPKS